MRVADRLGRPLSYVLSEIPDWELPYWQSWCAREPDAGRRVEFAVAQLTRNFIAANSKKGHRPPDLSDLVVPDWYLERNHQKAVEADSDTFTQAFAKAGLRVITKKSPRRH